jgi:acetyl esterase
MRNARSAPKREFRHGTAPVGHDCQRPYLNYLPGRADPADPRISPLTAPTLEGLPATVLAVAEFDPLRDQGADYGTRLRAAGVPVSEHPGTGLIHGYADMIGRSPAARAEVGRVVASVAQTLAAAAPAAY